MSQHSEPIPGTPVPPPAKSRRRFLTGVLTGGLFGSLLAGSINVFSHTSHSPGGWLGGHGPWGQHRHGMHDTDTAGEHVELATDWLLTRIRATPEQRQHVQSIVQETVSDLAQVKDQHRQYHQALLEALGQTTVDRDTLRNVRAAAVQLLDTASRRMVEAVAEVAETLTPEQRTELLSFMSRFHRL